MWDIDSPTLEDVLNDDSGILDTSDDLSIFKYLHIPKEEDRAKPTLWQNANHWVTESLLPTKKCFIKYIKK